MKQHTFNLNLVYLLALLISTWSLSSCSDDLGGAPTGSLEGRITNALTGEPVNDATISLTGEERRSETVGSDGTYSFENLLVGTYTITASKSQFETNSTEVSVQAMMTAEGDLEIIPVSSLEVKPTTLDFSTAINQLDVTFTNTGTSTINYEIQTSADWITVSKGQGILGAQNSDLLTVTVDRRRLDVGDVQGSIVFNVPGKGNRTVLVLASKLSNNAPVLIIGNGSLDFGKSLRSRTLQITNAGSTSLLWELSAGENWISADQPDGSVPPGNSQNITVFVDRANQDEGNHNGQLNFTSNGGSANVAIKMIVDPNAGDPGGIVVTSGLRAYYTFDDDKVTDLMNNFEAVNFGASPSNDIPNSNGKSFSFDGVDDFLQIAGNPINNTNPEVIHASISFWIKSSGEGAIFSIPRADDDQQNELIAGLSNARVYHSFDYHLNWWTWGYFGLKISDLLYDNNWHHLTLAYEGASKNVSLYIDGILLSNEQYLIDGTLIGNTSRVGADYNNGSGGNLGHFSGLLDNIRIYNRPISDSEVKEIFNARQ
ncbi:MAG: carboxypeptidase regulatory-like domain-containing protein [Bacteroidota bacterium]